MASGTQVGEASIALKFDAKSLSSSKKDVTLAATSTGESAGESFLKGFSTFTLANLASSGIQKVLGAITSQIDSAISRVDTMNNFPKVMSSLGFSAEEAASSIQTMSNRLDGLPTTMNGLVSDVQKLTATMGNLNKGTVNATTLGLALNDMFLAGGKGTEAASAAMEQYNQMLAQGKPDMQSWRSMLNAAPGQLKQLAKTLLGAKAGQQDLYEALQKGKIKFEQLNEAIVNLDQKGGEGFDSFEKQARAATGGVGTALQNVQSRISKAVATVIDTIGADNIANAINAVSSQFGNIGKAVASFVKVSMEKIGDFVRFLQNNVWVVDLLKTVLTTILSLEIAGKIANIRNKLVDLFTQITSFAAANPLLALAAGFGAIVAAVINFTSHESSFAKSIRETREASEAAVKSYKDLAESRKSAMQERMNEIDYYNDLHGELLLLVDENGKVKEGYEARARYITNELSKAVGVEIQLNDGIIDSWGEINEQIGKNIELKYKEAQLNSEEEAYNEALKKRAESMSRITELRKQITHAMVTGSFQEVQEAIKAAKALEEEEELYKKYSWDIQRYTDDMAAFLDGRYNDMSEAIWTYTDTLTASDIQNQAKLNETIRTTEEKLKYNESLYQQTGLEIYKTTAESYRKIVDNAKSSLSNYNGVVTNSMEAVKNGFCAKIDETVVKAATKNGQFTSLGKTEVNSLAAGMNSQAHNMFNAGLNAINAFTNGENNGSGNALAVIQNVSKSISSIAGAQYGAMYVNGQNLMYGLGNGLASRGFAVVSNVFNQFMSDFKWMFGIHSPSTVFRDQIGVMLARGLGIGFENEMVPVSEAMAEAVPRALPAPAITMANVPVSSASAVASRGYSLSDVYANEAEVVQGGVSIGKQEFIINDSFDAREAGRQFMQEVRRLA